MESDHEPRPHIYLCLGIWHDKLFPDYKAVYVNVIVSFFIPSAANTDN
jgi:hypothetical protein